MNRAREPVSMIRPCRTEASCSEGLERQCRASGRSVSRVSLEDRGCLSGGGVGGGVGDMVAGALQGADDGGMVA